MVEFVFCVLLTENNFVNILIPFIGVKENVIFYSLANPAASNGECARCSVREIPLNPPRSNEGEG
jgi:hypothetical protein